MEIDKFLLKIALESNDFEAGVKKVNKAIDGIGNQAEATARRKTEADEREAKKQKKIAEKAANDQKKIADKAANDQIALEKKLANEIEKNKYHSTSSQRKALKSAVDPEVVNAKKIADDKIKAYNEAVAAKHKIDDAADAKAKKTADARTKYEDKINRGRANAAGMAQLKERENSIKLTKKLEDENAKKKAAIDVAIGKGTEKQFKESQDQVSKTTSGFNKLLKSILAIGVAFVAFNKLKNFAENLTESDASVYRMSQNIGVATEDLSALHAAIDQLGGAPKSIDALFSSMQNMSEQWKDFGQAPEWITDPKGLYGTKLNTGKFFSVDTSNIERLRMLNEEFSHFKTLAQGLAHGEALGHGLNDPALVKLLMKNREEFEKTILAMKKIGVENEKDGKEAVKRDNAWKKVQLRIDELGRTILTRLSPIFVKLATDLLNWLGKAENIKWLTNSVDSLVKALRDIDFASGARNVSAFVTSVNDVVTALGGWLKAGEALLALWIGQKFVTAMANLAAFGKATNAMMLASAGGVAAGAAEMAAGGVAAGAVAGGVAAGAVNATTMGAAMLAGIIPLAMAAIMGYGIGTIINMFLSDEIKDWIGGSIDKTIRGVEGLFHPESLKEKNYHNPLGYIPMGATSNIASLNTHSTMQNITIKVDDASQVGVAVRSLVSSNANMTFNSYTGLV